MAATSYARTRFDRPPGETPQPPVTGTVPWPPGMKGSIFGAGNFSGLGRIAPMPVPPRDPHDWDPSPGIPGYPQDFPNPGVPGEVIKHNYGAWEKTGGGGGGIDIGNIPDPAAAQSSYIWDKLTAILEGKDLPFGPGEIATQKGQAKSASENAFTQAKDEIQGQQAATGFASSPAAARQLVSARIGASQQYGKASSAITIAAATENFNARMGALMRAQQWIDSLRSYTSTMFTSAWQRDQAMAELDLARQRLEQEIELERAKLLAEIGGG